MFKFRWKKMNGLSISSIVFCVIFMMAILYPLAFMLSSAVKDDVSLYDMPPKLIPKASQSIEIISDYSDLSELPEDELLEAIKKDCITSMFSVVYECSTDSIGEIKYFANVGEKTVFSSRAHRALLKLELDFGSYARIVVNNSTLVASDKHKTVMEAIGYKFNLKGLSNIKFMEQKTGEINIGEFLGSKYELEGQLRSYASKSAPMLMLENFKYYLRTPSYAFSENPFIQKYGFFAFAFNTLFGLLIALVSQIGLSTLTAFALSKLFDKKTASILLLVFLATMMIPFISIFIPILNLFRSIGITNKQVQMFAVHLYPDAFFTFICKGFFDQLPNSLFEAATIDGASTWKTFTRICLPLSKPVIAVIALNAFVREWGNFFWYFIVASDTPKYWTMNLAVYNLGMNPMMKPNVVMGMATVMAIPIIVATIIFSRQIKESVIGSGIKG